MEDGRKPGGCWLINLHIYNLFPDGKGQWGFAEEARQLVRSGSCGHVAACHSLTRCLGYTFFSSDSQTCGGCIEWISRPNGILPRDYHNNLHRVTSGPQGKALSHDGRGPRRVKTRNRQPTNLCLRHDRDTRMRESHGKRPLHVKPS